MCTVVGKIENLGATKQISPLPDNPIYETLIYKIRD